KAGTLRLGNSRSFSLKSCEPRSARCVEFRAAMVPLVILAWLLVAGTADAQDLGHKLPGVIGLDAARIPEPGLYLVDRLVDYSADELRDRAGREIALEGLELRGLANGIGVSYTSRLSQKPLLLTLTAAAPLAHLSLNVHDRPEAGFDRFGLTDFYVQPVRLGWRGQQFDAIGSVPVFLPSGKMPAPGGGGATHGQKTHPAARR